MKQFSLPFSDIADLHAFLAQTTVRDAARDAKSVLVQVYQSDDDKAWISQVVTAILALRADAVIAGAITFGQISAGKVAASRTTISLSCFETAELMLVEQTLERGNEVEAAHRLVEAIRDLEPATKGVLLLSTPLTVDCDRLLTSLHALSPGLPVFGGGSADISLQKMLVFSHKSLIDSGMVAVVLYGGTLEIMRRLHNGWLPLGRKMIVTKADGTLVQTINGQPAMDIYKRYLGITSDERFFLNVMEFPLLVERNSELHARVPFEVVDGKSIRFTADLKEGEEVHFGYARIGWIQKRIADLEECIRRFGPEAIHLYSCIIRHFVLQRDIDMELAPFERLAPTAGFFTAGEFCSKPESNAQYNAVMVVAAMRESPNFCRREVERQDVPAQISSNLYEDNHMRILLRYQHFMQAITEDLQAANEELVYLAEHDALTGLHNRRKMSNVIQVELDRSGRYGKVFSVIVCDIDYFKQFNDRFGHQAGDMVLKGLAQSLRHEARTTDVVCRFGGEEFLIIMPETEAHDAIEFAERVRCIVQSTSISHQGSPLPATTMSFGVAGYPQNGNTEDELISAADAALYDAKRRGRNQVCLSQREAGKGH